MTDEQRDHLKHRLQEERERVVAALARFGERRRDEHSESVSRTGHETDIYNQALDALEVTRLTRELAGIEHALKLLREMPERFGLDEQTGEPIAFDYLDKVPWARTVRPAEDATDPLAVDTDVLRAYRNERYSG